MRDMSGSARISEITEDSDNVSAIPTTVFSLSFSLFLLFSRSRCILRRRVARFANRTDYREISRTSRENFAARARAARLLIHNLYRARARPQPAENPCAPCNFKIARPDFYNSRNVHYEFVIHIVAPAKATRVYATLTRVPVSPPSDERARLRVAVNSSIQGERKISNSREREVPVHFSNRRIRTYAKSHGGRARRKEGGRRTKPGRFR